MNFAELHQGRFVLRNATPDDVMQMEAIQEACFPTLAAHEKLKAKHYLNHINIFKEGQWVVAEGEKIVASSSTLRIFFPEVQHNFLEVTDNLWITHTHMPDGDWLYQFDIGVLAAYRGLGIAKSLYFAQQEWVKGRGMKGQVLVGMTIGYEKYQHLFSIADYCEKLKNYQLNDPTVTPQRKAGFQWVQPVFNYLNDPTAGNCGIFMIWPV